MKVAPTGTPGIDPKRESVSGGSCGYRLGSFANWALLLRESVIVPRPSEFANIQSFQRHGKLAIEQRIETWITWRPLGTRQVLFTSYKIFTSDLRTFFTQMQTWTRITNQCGWHVSVSMEHKTKTLLTCLCRTVTSDDGPSWDSRRSRPPVMCMYHAFCVTSWNRVVYGKLFIFASSSKLAGLRAGKYFRWLLLILMHLVLVSSNVRWYSPTNPDGIYQLEDTIIQHKRGAGVHCLSSEASNSN